MVFFYCVRDESNYFGGDRDGLSNVICCTKVNLYCKKVLKVGN